MNMIDNDEVVRGVLKRLTLTLNKIEGYEDVEIKLVQKPKPKKLLELVKKEK